MLLRGNVIGKLSQDKLVLVKKKPTTHTTSVASLLCNTLPPSKEDPIHVKYQKSLVSFQNTMLVSPGVYKPIDYKKINLSNPPADVLRLII